MMERLAVSTKDMTIRLAVRTARECLQTATDLTMRLPGSLTPDQESGFQNSYIPDQGAGFQNSIRDRIKRLAVRTARDLTMRLADCQDSYRPY
jgi:hypothetical protein